MDMNIKLAGICQKLELWFRFKMQLGSGGHSLFDDAGSVFSDK
jgi:hypothetical protein